jgi:hypothetical protein
VSGAVIPELLTATQKIYLQLKDAVGNVLQIPKEIDFDVSLITDSTGPLAEAASAALGNGGSWAAGYTAELIEIIVPFTETASGLKTLKFSNNNIFSEVKVTVNDTEQTVSSYTDGTITFSTPLRVSGTYLLVIRGKYDGDEGTVTLTTSFTAPDAVGNSSTGTLSPNSLIVDKTGPVVSGGAVETDGITITGITINDEGAGFTLPADTTDVVSVDSGTAEIENIVSGDTTYYTITGTTAPTSENPVTYTLTVTDKAGVSLVYTGTVSTANDTDFIFSDWTAAADGPTLPSFILNLASAGTGGGGLPPATVTPALPARPFTAGNPWFSGSPAERLPAAAVTRTPAAASRPTASTSAAQPVAARNRTVSYIYTRSPEGPVSAPAGSPAAAPEAPGPYRPAVAAPLTTRPRGTAEAERVSESPTTGLEKNNSVTADMSPAANGGASAPAEIPANGGSGGSPVPGPVNTGSSPESAYIDPVLNVRNLKREETDDDEEDFAAD